ncbi:MAG: HDOD domain-containing protein [Verrucomicrobia bacterium]|nr:HDOD domain-containing protein [Verrucomicrobiota bacterium]
MTSNFTELVDGSCTLPSMPVVATRVMRELMDPQATADSLSKIVETDQALLTRILKIANSAFYGCARKVGSIQLAIVVLGFNTLKNLVIATSTRSLYQKQSLAEQTLWEHSLAVGIASHVLAMALSPGNLDNAFTVGLLHDVGKLVLYQQDPEGYSAILDGQAKGATCYEPEQKLLGFTHAHVGAVLMNRWNLPENFELAIGLHHSLDGADFNRLKPQPKQLTALVNLADTIAKRVISGNDMAPTDGMPMAMETLGATNEQVDNYISMIKETLDQEKHLFED